MRGHKLGKLLGGPGFLDRLPPLTYFDLVNGTLDIPQRGDIPARFVRACGNLWHSVEGHEEISLQRPH